MPYRLERALLRSFDKLPGSLQRLLVWRPTRVDGQVLNPALQLGLAVHAHTTKPLESLTPDEARLSLRATNKKLGPAKATPIALVSEGHLPGPAGPLRFRRYRPASAPGVAPALLFFHGGGHVIGDLDTHDEVCRVLVARSGIQVIAVDYRLAPEAPFPAAFDDALAAFRWARGEGEALGIDRERLAIGGDSAGGNLAAAVSLAAARAGEPTPAFSLLFYPLLDASQRGRSYDLFGRGFGLDVSTIDWFLGHYLGPEGARIDWRVSPLRAADLSGLPPTYIATAGFDPLRDEAARWVERLAAAGVAVEHRRHVSLIHGFVNLLGALSEAREAVIEAADALARGLSPGGATTTG